MSQGWMDLVGEAVKAVDGVGPRWSLLASNSTWAIAVQDPVIDVGPCVLGTQLLLLQILIFQGCERNPGEGEKAVTWKVLV